MIYFSFMPLLINIKNINDLNLRYNKKFSRLLFYTSFYLRRMRKIFNKCHHPPLLRHRKLIMVRVHVMRKVNRGDLRPFRFSI